jgi:hypothetical protein
MAIKYKQHTGAGSPIIYTGNNNVVSKILFYASGGDVYLYPGVGVHPLTSGRLPLVNFDDGSNSAGPNGAIGRFYSSSGSFDGSNIVYLAPNDQLVWDDNTGHRLTLIIFEESASQA